MRLPLLAALVFAWAAPQITSAAEARNALPRDFRQVIQKLRKRGVSARFIAEARAVAAVPELDRWVKPNVFGFKIRPDYSGHISPAALERSREFIQLNQAMLLYAEAEYGVSAEIITALLWVETKLGSHTGSAPIVPVFMNLALADHPLVLERMRKLLRAEIDSKDPQYKVYRRKLQESSKRKSKWAVDQLVALDRIWRKQKLDVFAIRGSYAGAFGMAQFIPESYVTWARSKSGRRPDLFEAGDAVLSVAHYLSKHGWKKSKPETWKKALYGYNRSEDYGRTILELAELLKPQDRPRSVAGAGPDDSSER